MHDRKPQQMTTLSCSSAHQELLTIPLDQLRPHSLDLRVRRNPAYDALKTSIYKRGLATPLSITRQPDETCYRICCDGNTRLAILRELWVETEDARFFHIHCHFHRWPTRGTLKLLTGYLAHNSQRRDLTFVEQAIGVAKAHQLYEQEAGSTINPTELADRLTVDGYSVTLPQIHLMIGTIRHLLPVIPNRLYDNLECDWIEQLLRMRRASRRIWTRHAGGRRSTPDFSTLFRAVLSPFDKPEQVFTLQRVRDALIGQMSEQTGADYDLLTLELEEVLDVHDRMLNLSGLSKRSRSARIQPADNAYGTNAAA